MEKGVISEKEKKKKKTIVLMVVGGTLLHKSLCSYPLVLVYRRLNLLSTHCLLVICI